MVKCVVSGCPNRLVSGENRSIFNRPPKRFFQFPKDPARVKVWLAALRETQQHDPAEPHFICEDHFLPEDISRNQVSSEAIPIMPPCVDGGLGMMGPWGGVAEEEDDPWTMDADEEGEEEVGRPAGEAPPSGQRQSTRRHSCSVNKASAVSAWASFFGALTPPSGDCASPHGFTACNTRRRHRGRCRFGKRLRRFLELMLASPDHLVDVRRLMAGTESSTDRMDDITGVLEDIRLIEKQSAHRFKWIGKSHISSFLWKNQQEFQAEMEKLKLVESVLDGLIKSCSQQLFEVTDNLDSTLAYVSLADISRLKDFQQQTVMVVKAPEETKLEVPAPREDSIQVHLKAEQGPILVLTCDIGGGEETYGCFLALEESRIKTAELHTEAPRCAVQSA
uniref:THAP-type domain-containing protein n=1 Tax=Tetraodon nigroviridis TaxID=99883 RepID=H3CZF0_TETNG